MDTNNLERRNIKVKLKTYNKLKAKGFYGETMDDIINRLMFNHNKKSTSVISNIEDKI